MIRADDMNTPVTYNLSSIDQSLIRTYIRYCLCFPTSSDEQSERDKISAKLSSSAKRALSYLPMLAGTVHPIPLCSSRHSQEAIQHDANVCRSSAASFIEVGQRGRVEVIVTLEQVNKFSPTIKVLSKEEFPQSFAELVQEEMPADAFVGKGSMPLPDAPDPKASEGNKVFAIQANFIKGGVLVMLQLHHAAADISGMSAIIRHMSISDQVLPLKQLTYQIIVEDAKDQDRQRDRLCGSRGLRASYEDHPEYDTSKLTLGLAPQHGSCHVLAFSLEMLEATTAMLNERFQFLQDDPPVQQLSAFDTLVAMLWKAVTRAHWPPGSTSEGQLSALLLPAYIGKKVFPSLEDDFYGNSRLFSYHRMSALKLTLPYDVGTISKTALAIRTQISKMNESHIRSAIAIINERDDVRTINHPCIDFSTDVFVTDWSSLPVGAEASLGLGLGSPSHGRKPSRQHSGYGCVLLPRNKERGVWEVLAQLTEDAMERLLNDEGLLQYVEYVA